MKNMLLFQNLMINMRAILLLSIILFSSCGNKLQEEKNYFDLKALTSVPLTGELIEEEFFAYVMVSGITPLK